MFAGGDAQFVIDDVAIDDDHVGVLRIAEGDEMLGVAFADRFAEVGVAHEDDPQAVAAGHGLGYVDVDVLHDRLLHIVITLNH